jgi:ketopantoate reductase
MMAEAQSIASTLGITFRHTIEQRVEGAERAGEHKTSMLQDLEAGKPLEKEALIGAVLENGPTHQYADAGDRGSVWPGQAARRSQEGDP